MTTLIDILDQKYRFEVLTPYLYTSMVLTIIEYFIDNDLTHRMGTTEARLIATGYILTLSPHLLETLKNISHADINKN